MIEWHEPFSRTIARLGHDPDTNELFVEWAKGKSVSVYSGVSFEKFDQIRRSPSVGSALHTEIKPHHPHRYAE